MTEAGAPLALHVALMALGALFLLGLAADELGRRSRVPRVTLLLLIGAAIGPGGLDLLPAQLAVWYEFLAAAALTMVAFLLGNSLTLERLRGHGREVLLVSLGVTAASLVIVGVGLYAFGAGPVVALVMAGVATATAPAATMDVIRQSGAKGRFPEILTGIVAVDDAWGLIAFSLALILAGALAGDGAGGVIALAGLRDMGGAIGIGLLVGVPTAFFSGRIRAGEPLQSEALGAVFLCAGIAVWAGVSFLLAGIVAGMVVANLARHHERAFHEIERVEWPFMLLFFLLAGATFHAGQLGPVLPLVAAYCGLRVLARLVGGQAGARMAHLPGTERRWIGMALLPQAGVAVGMALVAGDHFPELRDTILSVTIAATIFFEVVGPIATMIALRRTGAADTAQEAR